MCAVKIKRQQKGGKIPIKHVEGIKEEQEDPATHIPDDANVPFQLENVLIEEGFPFVNLEIARRNGRLFVSDSEEEEDGDEEEDEEDIYGGGKKTKRKRNRKRKRKTRKRKRRSTKKKRRRKKRKTKKRRKSKRRR